MHKKNVLHRDLKSDNILCNENGDVKIGDLGLSTFLTEERTLTSQLRGNTKFFSPEIANKESYGPEIDVWALGCFAFELAMGHSPYE